MLLRYQLSMLCEKERQRKRLLSFPVYETVYCVVLIHSLMHICKKPWRKTELGSFITRVAFTDDI